jgi:hypothetical protein
LMYHVLQFFGRRWSASANLISLRTGTVTGWPHAVKASDGYLAARLKITSKQARTVINDLDRLGYIQAAFCAPSGQPNKRGIYYYFPGSGIPPDQPTRHPKITPRGALDWMRKQRAVWEAAKQEDEKRRLELDGCEAIQEDQEWEDAKYEVLDEQEDEWYSMNKLLVAKINSRKRQ